MLGALTADPDGDDDAAVRQTRFFVIFALVQAWSIAVGFVLGVGFTSESTVDAIILVTCLVLASTTNRSVHVVGLAVVWLMYLAGAAFGTLA